MDPGDIFRRFFGFEKPPWVEPEGESRRQWSDWFSEEDEDEPFFHGSFHFGVMHDTQEFIRKAMQDMDEALGQMRGFQSEFTSVMGDPWARPGKDVAPRREMLKDPDADEEPQKSQHKWLCPPDKKCPQDRDLDWEVQRKGVDAILQAPPAQPEHSGSRSPWAPHGGSNFFGNGGWFFGTQTCPGQFQYESTEIRMDGPTITKRVESHYSGLDEEGREVTKVIREDGNLRHTVTTTRDKSGREETQELFERLSGGKISGRQTEEEPRALPPSVPALPPPPPSWPGEAEERQKRSLFQKLFGFAFRTDT